MQLRHLLNNKVLVVLDQGVVSGAAMLTQFMVAGSLGMQEYGHFSVLVLVQLFLLSIQQAGITGIFQVRYPAKPATQQQDYFRYTWALQLVFMATVLVASFAVLAWQPTNIPTAFFTAGLLNILMYLLQDFFRRVLITMQELKKATIADSLNNGLQIAGLAILIIAQKVSLTTVLWICGASYLPAILLAIYWLKPVTGNIFNTLQQYGIDREAGWMTGAALLQWFAGNFFIVAAGWYMGAATLGALRLGQYVFGLLNVLLQAIESYILPKASEVSATPSNAIRYLGQVLVKMLFSLGIILFVVALAAKTVLGWLQVANTQELLPVIYGLCATYILVIAGYPVRMALRALSMSNVFFKGYIINALFGLSTTSLLISRLQLNGVLLGLFLSQALLITYWVSMLHRKHNILCR